MTKTIKVNLVKETANRMLMDSPNDAVDYRQGVINMTQTLLMETQNYRGFRYLSKDEVAPGYTVGVHLDNPKYVHDFANTDRTRVFIY